jgi:hypothetical protein
MYPGSLGDELPRATENYDRYGSDDEKQAALNTLAVLLPRTLKGESSKAVCAELKRVDFLARVKLDESPRVRRPRKRLSVRRRRLPAAAS